MDRPEPERIPHSPRIDSLGDWIVAGGPLFTSQPLNRVVVVDDHPLFRQAIRTSLLKIYPGVELIEAQDLLAALDAVAAYPDSDLILLDLRLPGAMGLSALTRLRAVAPQIPVLVISAEDSPAVMSRALQNGACGFIPKSVELNVLRSALQAVLVGDLWLPDSVVDADHPASGHPQDEPPPTLSPQQLRVLALMVDGLANPEIAERLGIAASTTKAHVAEIFRRLRVQNRTQAVMVATQVVEFEGAGTA